MKDINTIELDLLDIRIRTFITEGNGLSVFNSKHWAKVIVEDVGFLTRFSYSATIMWWRRHSNVMYFLPFDIWSWITCRARVDQFWKVVIISLATLSLGEIFKGFVMLLGGRRVWAAVLSISLSLTSAKSLDVRIYPWLGIEFARRQLGRNQGIQTWMTSSFEDRPWLVDWSVGCSGV